MKRALLLFSILLAAFLPSKSATYLVEVEDFEFDPAFLTVNVGDTIVWVWEDGFHTTTSTTIPAGATSWDNPITSTSPAFTYIPAIAGTYMYVCQPHASMGMQGVITVNSTVGISEHENADFILAPRIIGNDLVADFTLPAAGKISISIADASGRQIDEMNQEQLSAGTYQRRVSVAGFKSGLYIFSLGYNRSKLTHRFIVE